MWVGGAGNVNGMQIFPNNNMEFLHQCQQGWVGGHNDGQILVNVVKEWPKKGCVSTQTIRSERPAKILYDICNPNRQQILCYFDFRQNKNPSKIM